jgi:signal peptidase I
MADERNNAPFTTHPSSPAGATAPTHDRETPETREVPGGGFGELVRFSIGALIIVFLIRTFVAQPFIVSGASMADTLSTGEYLIIDQVSYYFSEPARGDVIVFRYPNDPSKFFIKRIIGTPGDTVAIIDGAVRLSKAGATDTVVLTEPYVTHSGDQAEPLSVTLGAGEYFVMGDNRGASSDSRAWGALPAEHIVGRALLRLFPLDAVSVMPGAYDLVGAEETKGS